MPETEKELETLMSNFEKAIAEANTKISELNTKKQQLTEALDWNQGYLERSEAIKGQYEAFVKTLSEANINGLLDDAKKNVADLEKDKASVSDILKKAMEDSSELAKEINEIGKYKTDAKDVFAAIESIKKQVDQHGENVGKVSSFATDAAKILQTVKTDESVWVSDSKKQIDNFITEATGFFEKFNKEVIVKKEKAEELLLLSTNVSLANAFGTKREQLNKFADKWNGYFLASILSMIVIAALFLIFGTSTGDFGHDLFIKLPYIAPLIWLAYLAQSRSSLYSRLADNYGFKESVSLAFEGYKRQVEDIDDDSSSKDAIKLLFKSTLEAIGSNPDEIHKIHVSPEMPLEKLAKEFAKVTENTDVGDLKKWLKIVGTSSGVAILGLLWLLFKH